MIAWYPTKNAALSLSRGLERDRAVDESGNQIAIFGRIGSRPFHLDEMQQLYLRKDGTPWFVDDNAWRERRTATDEQKTREGRRAWSRHPITPSRAARCRPHTPRCGSASGRIRSNARMIGVDFLTKLAREQGWTRDYARAAIDEYRRYCFLAQPPAATWCRAMPSIRCGTCI